MMRYNALKQRPRHFQTFTGLTVEEFDQLIKENKEDWQEQRIKRLNKGNPKRKRKIGGGRKHILETFEDQLLLTILWAKLYPTYLILEYLFGVDESTAYRAIEQITLLLKGRFALPEQRGVRRGKKITTIEELKEIIPNLDKILVDGTEQRIPRPKKKQKRKKYYSGKKKAFTIKKQVATSGAGFIIHSSRASPGRKHDYNLFKESGLGEMLPTGVPIYQDSGYQGVNKDYPDLDATIPHKRSKNHPKLTRSQKIQNTKQRKKRVKIEHTNSKLKKYQVLAGVYRHSLQNYDTHFDFVANIINFRMLCRQQAG